MNIRSLAMLCLIVVSSAAQAMDKHAHKDIRLFGVLMSGQFRLDITTLTHDINTPESITDTLCWHLEQSDFICILNIDYHLSQLLAYNTLQAYEPYALQVKKTVSLYLNINKVTVADIEYISKIEDSAFLRYIAQWVKRQQRVSSDTDTSFNKTYTKILLSTHTRLHRLSQNVKQEEAQKKAASEATKRAAALQNARQDYPYDLTLSEQLAQFDTPAHDKTLVNTTQLTQTYLDNTQQSEKLVKERARLKTLSDMLAKRLEITKKAQGKTEALANDTDFTDVETIKQTFADATQALEQQKRLSEEELKQKEADLAQLYACHAQLQEQITSMGAVLLEQIDNRNQKAQFIDREMRQALVEQEKATIQFRQAKERLQKASDNLALLAKHQAELKAQEKADKQATRALALTSTKRAVESGGFSPASYGLGDQKTKEETFLDIKVEIL